jgi:hypothetical protein
MTGLAACAKSPAGEPPANATGEPPANAVGHPASEAAPSGRVVTINSTTMARLGAVDPRFVSYNVEMLEVTGGKFWKPYEDIAALPAVPDEKAASAGVPAGMSAELYQYREPIDLENPRLRTLAAALGPAYMRVSGTWANTTYFADTDEPPAAPPKGYGGVLTRRQWQGVVDFSRAVDAPIVTSVPIGAGTRDAKGVWTPAQTRRWFAFTRSIGGTIAATEFMNEPTLASMGGAPAGYDAAAFGRDFKVFREFVRKDAPEIKVLGPGSVGETTGDWGVASGGYASGMKLLPAGDLVAAGGADVDAFSYHHYGAVSQRCAAMGHQTTAAAALSEDWLRRTDQTLAYYRKVRDTHMPGKHFWNTETADAACGGNPWGGQFLDTFRYLDQLGRLARQEVDVVMHNTLVASDYGMLDDRDFTPKPNYWGALLWRRLMGTDVLDSGVPTQEGQHVYAHCLRDEPGGVALLVLNTDKRAPTTLNLGEAVRNGMRYTLTSPKLESRTVLLNSQPLALNAQDQLPMLRGEPLASKQVAFAPVSITFVALPNANNDACAQP